MHCHDLPRRFFNSNGSEFDPTCDLGQFRAAIVSVANALFDTDLVVAFAPGQLTEMQLHQ